MTIRDEVHSWSLPQPLDIKPLAKLVPSAIAQILIKRGIDTPRKLSDLLDPPHKLPHNPLRISSMDTALRRLVLAVDNQERVGVFLSLIHISEPTRPY